MSVLPILTWPDARLAETCAPCTPAEETRRLAQAMLDTMYAAPGRGLAAPQIGRMIRLFVMDVTWKEGTPAPQVFLNPEITWRSEATATGEEGCLSIPGITTQITRPAEIDLRWQDLDGQAHSGRFDGFAAACIQHETDHLDGVLTLDRLTPEARAEAVAAYEARA